MSGYLNTLFFGIYPYIALVVLIVGTIVRYDREPYTWKSGSSQLLRRKQLLWGSVLFHVGVLVIFVGHLIGLLTPIEYFDTFGISHTFKQGLAVIAGGIAGAVAIVGATLLAHRRLFDRRVRAASSTSDTIVIMLLWIQLGSGTGNHPDLAATYGRSPDAEVHGMGTGHLHLQSGSCLLRCGRGANLQGALVSGAHHLADFPVHSVWSTC